MTPRKPVFDCTTLIRVPVSTHNWISKQVASDDTHKSVVRAIFKVRDRGGSSWTSPSLEQSIELLLIHTSPPQDPQKNKTWFQLRRRPQTVLFGGCCDPVVFVQCLAAAVTSRRPA